MLKGPLIQAATFCETAIEGKDGTISIIRMIDRMTVATQEPDAPREMPPVTRLLTSVITLKGGSAKGRSDVRVVMEAPSAEKKDVFSATFLAEAEDRGQNYIVRLNVTFEHEGVHWFHIYADDECLTSMPFRLVYVRQSAGQS